MYKKGILYVPKIKQHCDLIKIYNFFQKFGLITRVFVSSEICPCANKKFYFVSGWIEFGNKSCAKKICILYHKFINIHDKSGCYPIIYYLRKFKWSNLYVIEKNHNYINIK